MSKTDETTCVSFPMSEIETGHARVNFAEPIEIEEGPDAINYCNNQALLTMESDKISSVALSRKKGAQRSPCSFVKKDKGDINNAAAVFPIFVQMNVRWEGIDDNWREASRWVRFEEDVEECGKRWSKPHVPSFSLSAFNELKKTFESGLIVFDVIGQSLDQLLDSVSEIYFDGILGLVADNCDTDQTFGQKGTISGPRISSINSKGRVSLTMDNFEGLKALLNMKTKLRVQTTIINRVSVAVKPNDSNSTIINKISSLGKSGETLRTNQDEDKANYITSAKLRPFKSVPAGDNSPHGSPKPCNPLLVKAKSTGLADDSLTSSTGSCSSLEDHAKDKAKDSFARLMSSMANNSSSNPFAKKVPKGAESCVILAATVDFAQEPILIWMRLQNSLILENVCELAGVTPTKFLCIVLTPVGETTLATEMGRVVGAMMSDQLFATAAYEANHKEELIKEMLAYTNEMTVLAPSAWDPSIRLEPPKSVPSVKKRMLSGLRQSMGHGLDDDANASSHDHASVVNGCKDNPDSGHHQDGDHGYSEDEDRANMASDIEGAQTWVENLDGSGQARGRDKDGDDEGQDNNGDQDDGKDDDTEKDDDTLMATGRMFGGLVRDVKRKLPWYLSDFKDAMALQSVASIIYIYLATITKAITFGGFLSDTTSGLQGVLESFLGHALSGGLFCLFGGQPLTVLGCTGPVLIFEKILVDCCHDYGLDYMTFRLWIGLWSSLLCLVIVATDASVFVRYFTRFTEESFAALIGIIFIIESLKKLFYMSKTYKVHKDFDLDHLSFEVENCHCVPPASMDVANHHLQGLASNGSELLEVISKRINATSLTVGNIPWKMLGVHECNQFGGHLAGIWCDYVPDIFFFSVLLFCGTYIFTTQLKQFKLSPYFPSKVRSLISDYAVIIAILVFALIDNAFHLQTPKLIVPTVFKPTRSDLRGWLVPFFHDSFSWYIYLLALVPSLLLTILLFMDQQITSVIVNRKEHKLKKGCGYHLDMLMVGITMGLCSILGLPWCVAATVLCLGHVDSLKMETECRAPGETPQFLGVREQRVTGTMVFVLTGLSVKLAPILKFIPMPVLYGVLMYMGVSSLKGMQMIERCAIVFMPPKYQPDYTYLRHVPLAKVHLFTFFQILGLALLWLIKSTPASLVFPLMVLALVGIRKAMDFFPKVFSQNDLYWLDSLMPDSKTKNKNKGDEGRQAENKCFRRFRRKRSDKAVVIGNNGASAAV